MPKSNKNKQRKSRKQHAGPKQKETAYDKLSRETDGLTWDMATIADKLLDLLPRFKRLSAKNRKLIFDHMDGVLNGLIAAVDDYWEALPENMREEDEEPKMTYRETIGGVGMALGIASFFGSLTPAPKSDDEFQSPDFDPDVIDITPEKPKRLKGKE